MWNLIKVKKSRAKHALARQEWPGHPMVVSCASGVVPGISNEEGGSLPDIAGDERG